MIHKYAIWKRIKNKLPLLSKIKIIATAGICCAMSLNVDAVVKLRVDGNKVLADGEAMSIAGTSLFFTNQGWGGEKFYNDGVIYGLRADWESGILRAPMGVDIGNGGYIQEPEANLNLVRQAIWGAIVSDMHIIVGWHTHNAENFTNEAMEFFANIAKDFGHYENIIYEVYTEPGVVSWSQDVKPFAENVILAIRAHDPDNLIVVGTPIFSQNVDEASEDPINDENIAYGLHISAATHGDALRAKALMAMENNVPVFVTEWTTIGANGQGPVDEVASREWVNFFQQHDIHHVNFSIMDQADSLMGSALKPGASTNGFWPDNELSESGLLARQIVRDANPTFIDKDLDDDGVPNEIDRCRNTMQGARVDEDGCSGVILQAEIFSSAFDLSPGDNGHPFVTGRDVDTERSIDNGSGVNVGWTEDGEWLEYQFNGDQNVYEVSARVASNIGGGELSVTIDGQQPVSGGVANTGGWQRWETIDLGRVYVDGPTSTIRLNVVRGGFNINWIQFLPLDVGDGDGDGVNDAFDHCPNTPDGALVDERGCEISENQEVTVQAEDFSLFSDSDVGNNGGVYRETDVDIEASTDIDGGFNIGWTHVGEWLQYNVRLNPGTYELQSRVASDVGGGHVSYSIEGIQLESDRIPNTGGWQVWETHTITQLTIPESGVYRIRLSTITGDYNLNWIKFVPVEKVEKPIRRQAESYENFFDTTEGNTGGVFRSDDVDIENTTDDGNGANVGWIDAGEWLEYTFDVDGGNYNIDLRVASDMAGGSIQLSVDGVDVGSLINVPDTGGWQSWINLNTTLGSLSEGSHTLRVSFPSGPFNFNWFEISREGQ